MNANKTPYFNFKIGLNGEICVLSLIYKLNEMMCRVAHHVVITLLCYVWLQTVQLHWSRLADCIHVLLQ